jgi:NADH-quinone oxidoreductase subunit L
MSLRSSFKVFSFNFLSDIFLLTSFVLFFYDSNVSDLNSFFCLILVENLIEYKTIVAGSVCLMISAGVKSVQCFGHLWLVDSMEAPISASALIHSATLVTAGILLLLKFNFIYFLFELNFILFISGLCTSVFGGTSAVFQSDLKKLLAYSTMNHCGYA